MFIGPWHTIDGRKPLPDELVFPLASTMVTYSYVVSVPVPQFVLIFHKRRPVIELFELEAAALA
jgi:hypothetical protein